MTSSAFFNTLLVQSSAMVYRPSSIFGFPVNPVHYFNLIHQSILNKSRPFGFFPKGLVSIRMFRSGISGCRTNYPDAVTALWAACFTRRLCVRLLLDNRFSPCLLFLMAIAVCSFYEMQRTGYRPGDPVGRSSGSPLQMMKCIESVCVGLIR
jgi:hypothetical protein